MPPKLDRRTRKRIQQEEKIRAEEAYRAQVRQEMKDSTPPSPAPQRPGCGRTALYGLLFLTFLGLIAQLGGTDTSNTATSQADELRALPGYVSAAQEGDAWPFTFAEGLLECRRGSAVVVTELPDGATYALNGTASAMADQEGWTDLEHSGVWKDSPDPYTPKVSIGGMISQGLALCQ